jgi:hypothetical protein
MNSIVSIVRRIWSALWSGNQPPEPTQIPQYSHPHQGVVEGTICPPSSDEYYLLSLRDAYLAKRRYVPSFPKISNVTDNTATGLAGEHGGVFLIGEFSFIIDHTGAITSGWVKTQHTARRENITGGKVNYDGTFHLAYGPHGLSCEGIIKYGKLTGVACGAHQLITGNMTGELRPPCDEAIIN